MTYVAQEGGIHYQAAYQHWDWITSIRMGYLPGNATKYVSRWWKKNGLQDLAKAMTYVDKMLAVLDEQPNYKFNQDADFEMVQTCTIDFIESNSLPALESEFCIVLAVSSHRGSILDAKKVLEQLIETAKNAATAATLAGAGTGSQTPVNVAPAPPCGAAQGIAGQGAATNSPTGVGSLGHPAPFGYDEVQETGFSKVNITKTDSGYNG